MCQVSNSLIGILNLLTFLLSIPIVGAGVWLRDHGVSECQRFLETPVIVLGAFLMAVSIAGFIGACCRISCLLWLYLVVMFLLISLLFCFTIFAFAVTHKGAGEAVSGRGYKEYRLGDYSNWLRKRVGNEKNWNQIKSCLIESQICVVFNKFYLNDTLPEFRSATLTAIESGCCKPSDECGYKYVSAANWTWAPTNSKNPDCAKWDTYSSLCFNCDSCKAGVLDTLKGDWKKVAILNIVILVLLIIIYSIGCCAFNNTRRDTYTRAYRQYA